MQNPKCIELEMCILRSSFRKFECLVKFGGSWPKQVLTPDFNYSTFVLITGDVWGECGPVEWNVPVMKRGQAAMAVVHFVTLLHLIPRCAQRGRYSRRGSQPTGPFSCGSSSLTLLLCNGVPCGHVSRMQGPDSPQGRRGLNNTFLYSFFVLFCFLNKHVLYCLRKRGRRGIKR